MFRLFMKARFIVIEGNTFLGTIVPKSSINDQFVPLEILLRISSGTKRGTNCFKLKLETIGSPFSN